MFHLKIKSLPFMLTIMATLTCGIVIGHITPSSYNASAQRRETPKRIPFKSGSERSEPIFREIAATLKRIDKRIQNIEKVIQEKSGN